MTEPYELDLVILVPGKDERQTLEGLLKERWYDFNVKQIKFDLFLFGD